MIETTINIWRLEWPDGSGAYRGQAVDKLLPPCFQVFDDKWNTIDNHPSPNLEPKIFEFAAKHEPTYIRQWHFGFASREAFDRWFDPDNLNFVNSPQCAAGMLQIVCYSVPERWVVCGEHQTIFHPRHARRLSDCPCTAPASVVPPQPGDNPSGG